MSTSRTKNSIKNSISGLLSQGTGIIFKLIVRAVFIQIFAREFLGVNGLFSNILTVLSLTELGVGDALVYSMYAPLASENKSKLKKLMRLYSRAYTVIGLAIAVIGTAIIPLLPYIVEKMPKNPYLLKNFTLIYILFLINSVVSYFFSYKRSIINADQKGYVINTYTISANLLQSALQIAVLLLLPSPDSFIAYLSVQIFITLACNIAISFKADKMYPYIKDKSSCVLEKSEKKTIFDNIKALTVYKIGSVALDGTDNIIISKYCGLNLVGSLSNYTLVTASLQMLLYQISNSVTHSVGNAVATESNKKNRFIFDSMVLMNFMVYGFSSVCLFSLLPHFITIFAGKEYLLSTSTTAIIALNFFLYGSMNVIWTYRSTMGLFVHGRYRPVISAIINIIISIILAKYLDIAGVLLGTTITRVATNIWFDPYIVFKHGFKESVLPYYKTYIKQLIIIFVLSALTFYINSLIPNGIFFFIVKAIITAVITAGFIILIFRSTPEFHFVTDRLKKTFFK